MHWPVTQVNDLNLSVAAGYSDYLQHQELNRFYINPGSGLSFNIYSGDFVINLHDRISITENAYQNQSVNGNTINDSLQNTLGANALWDLNKALVMFGYDHGNYLALDSSQGASQGLPDAASENFFLNGGVRLVPEILAGLETGFGLVHYSRSGAASSIIDAGREAVERGRVLHRHHQRLSGCASGRGLYRVHAGLDVHQLFQRGVIGILSAVPDYAPGEPVLQLFVLRRPEHGFAIQRAAL